MGEKSKRGALGILFGLYLGEGREVFVILVYAVVIGIASLAVPIAVQSVVSSVAAASAIQPVVVLTAFVSGALVFSGFVRMVQLVVVERLQRRLLVRCAITLSNKLPKTSVRTFSKSYGSDYVIRFMELFAVQKITTTLLLDGSAVFFQIIVGLVLVSFYHPFFLVFSLLLVATLLLIIFVLGTGGIETRYEESEAKYEVMGWLQDLARHLGAFKSTNGERYSLERMDLLVTKYLLSRQAHFNVVFRQYGAAFLLQALGSALLLGLGSWLVIKGQLTLGQLVAAELTLGLVLVGITKLGKHLESVYDLAASVLKLDSLFNLPVEKQEGSFFGYSQGGASLSIHDLTVTRAGEASPLIQKSSFSLSSGEKAVLWGANSSGKSVLAEIIYRLEQPLSGRVEVDDHPVSLIHPRELRSQVSLVRGVEIISGTIRQNLTLGNRDVSTEELLRVLSFVSMTQVVNSLDDGLQTVISAMSHPFSNGEALRLMIARALISHPRLLIVDGTIDAMDSESQNRMIELFNSDVLGMTLLLLTHEISLSKSLPRRFRIDNTYISEVTRDGGGGETKS